MSGLANPNYNTGSRENRSGWTLQHYHNPQRSGKQDIIIFIINRAGQVNFFLLLVPLTLVNYNCSK